ncbi:hypothetical protein COW20_12490 [bacterium (Candidatus Blackallbacteria) CG13_big_fil_rev_8_21_14_2_50_49_14]|nr:MAG: hypothetical protein COW20_12490 [bacterium (Candidatus Blackallbacteria) CG13_big_fil_rev_8_21_14_2_50_49_14]
MRNVKLIQRCAGGEQQTFQLTVGFTSIDNNILPVTILPIRIRLKNGKPAGRNWSQALKNDSTHKPFFCIIPDFVRYPESDE